MRKIIVSYSATDPASVGTTREVDDAEGVQLVREGRARWADTEDPDEANNPNALSAEGQQRADGEQQVAEQNHAAAAAAKDPAGHPLPSGVTPVPDSGTAPAGATGDTGGGRGEQSTAAGSTETTAGTATAPSAGESTPSGAGESAPTGAGESTGGTGRTGRSRAGE